jgi:ABC-type transport system involved in multi-copper enzyme maturation permease subunit
MKILAVARFTLLRLWHTRYVLAAAVLCLFIFGVQSLAGRGVDSSLTPANTVAMYVSWLAAIWLGISLVQADRQDGTLRSTLTRPISLVEVLLGKLLGGLLYLTLLAAGMTAAVMLGALTDHAPLHWAAATYQIHLLPVHLTVMALSLLLAQVAPRFMAGFLMLFARDKWLLEKITELAGKLTAMAGDTLTGLGRILFFLLPPTSRFYLSYSDFADHSLPASTYLLLLVFSVHYAIAACLLAAWALRRQEL